MIRLQPTNRLEKLSLFEKKVLQKITYETIKYFEGYDYITHELTELLFSIPEGNDGNCGLSLNWVNPNHFISSGAMYPHNRSRIITWNNYITTQYIIKKIEMDRVILAHRPDCQATTRRMVREIAETQALNDVDVSRYDELRQFMTTTKKKYHGIINFEGRYVKTPIPEELPNVGELDIASLYPASYTIEHVLGIDEAEQEHLKEQIDGVVVKTSNERENNGKGKYHFDIESNPLTDKKE